MRYGNVSVQLSHTLGLGQWDSSLQAGTLAGTELGHSHRICSVISHFRRDSRWDSAGTPCVFVVPEVGQGWDNIRSSRTSKLPRLASRQAFPRSAGSARSTMAVVSGSVGLGSGASRLASRRRIRRVADRACGSLVRRRASGTESSRASLGDRHGVSRKPQRNSAPRQINDLASHETVSRRPSPLIRPCSQRS